MSVFPEELDYGDEIRGVICPYCGGSLVWRRSRAYCHEHGTVSPEAERIDEYSLERYWYE